MKEITLLHIGDIHFPDRDEEERPLFRRDSGFHTAMEEILPKASYMIVLEDLLEEIDKEPSAILFSGDLTTKGEIKGYNECLDFIKERVPLSYFEESNQKLFIVPGNHDLVREGISEESLTTKFDLIKKSINLKNFPELPIPTTKHGIIKNQNSSSVLIISINSCIGCGEIRHFPKEIQYSIHELFEKIKNESDKKLMDILCNELDTPVIEEKDITTAIKCIQQNETCLPILLAHHNLLPQRTIRLVAYSELLNGGHLRDKLMTLNKPVLFLHGHIHDDPIEIINSPRYKKSKIICISAPLFIPIKETSSKNIGFNKIKIIFGDDVPIGCEIELHRLNGAKMERKKERIRFWDPPNTVALLTEEEKIFSYVDSKMVYLNKIKSRYNGREEKKLTIEEVEEYVDRLSWLGLVEYENRDGPKELRCVGKVIP